MDKLSDILARAAQRSQAAARSYEGEVTPQEAFEILKLTPGAKLVDVRTRAEWDWVGRVPDSIEIEWNQYPGNIRNPQFLSELKARLEPGALILFLCRSGVRSVAAASAATEAGFAHCYNILEGFEGDKDGDSHRNNIGGWRKAGLPWTQG
ncbi:MAG: rhodanese-like domain-containing protein [Rhodocyclales bacterium GT-UBC]|nr:MAG: rhodanese-like domain-containing protein [Rhodocyclales bacterium GT-UBC]